MSICQTINSRTHQTYLGTGIFEQQFLFVDFMVWLEGQPEHQNASGMKTNKCVDFEIQLSKKCFEKLILNQA